MREGGRKDIRINEEREREETRKKLEGVVTERGKE